MERITGTTCAMVTEKIYLAVAVVVGDGYLTVVAEDEHCGIVAKVYAWLSLLNATEERY